jgi:hypothetical protein
MSPTRKSAARKKKTTTKKSSARKKTAAKKKAKATKKTAKKKATKATKKKAAKKKAKATKKTAKKAAKKTAKKAAKKTAKKVAKKAKQAEKPAQPAKPPKPGNLVVARGKQVSKLGDRWTCWACNAVFYDLNRPEAVCPKCGQDQAKKPVPEEKEKKPARRDSMRALRVLDDDDGPPADEDTDGVEMDLELGTDEKLLEQTDTDDED